MFFQITIVEKHCPKKICKGRYYSIFHVVAESSDKRSAIHYLWSVIDSPTIIVAYFKKPDVNVSIDWKQVLNKTSSKGIHFTERYEYITALVIPAIYEFQDPKDELYYTSDKVTNIVKHAFNQADWKEPEVDYKNNMTTFKASMLGGHVIFQVRRVHSMFILWHKICNKCNLSGNYQVWELFHKMLFEALLFCRLKCKI